MPRDWAKARVLVHAPLQTTSTSTLTGTSAIVPPAGASESRLSRKFSPALRLHLWTEQADEDRDNRDDHETGAAER